MGQTARDLHDEGRTTLEQGDWAKARSLLAAAFEREETAETLYLLARAVEWAGEYAGAIDLYER